MTKSKRASVLGATLIVALAITLTLAGLLKWVDSEKRVTQRHLLAAKAKYAAEAVSEYGAAQIRTVLEYQMNVQSDEFTEDGSNPPKLPTEEVLGDSLTDLTEQADLAGVVGNLLGGLLGGGSGSESGSEGGLLGGLLGGGSGGSEGESEGGSGTSGGSDPENTTPDDASPPKYTITPEQLFASSFSNFRWELVTASSPLYAEDPLRGQKVILRELSLLASASVTDNATGQSLTGYAEQVIQVRDAPLFGYALFYNMDLEIAPGATMNVYGPVHSNRHLYTQSSAGLDFLGVVTCAGNIYHGRAPGASGGTSYGAVRYIDGNNSLVPMLQGSTWVDCRLSDWAERASQLWEGGVLSGTHGVMQANPAGLPPYVPDDPLTNANELQNPARILVEPATPNSSSSYPGDFVEVEKFGSKACLVIEVSTLGVPTIYKYSPSSAGTYVRDTGTGLATYERKQLSLPTNLVVGAVASQKFYDTRRAQWVQVLDLDIGVLKAAIEISGNGVSPGFNNGSDHFTPETEWNGIVYVHHKNTTNGAVRLVNGSQLPDRPTAANASATGFTLAANVPAYIKGNYNANGSIDSDPSLIRNPDSSSEPPAAVIADAITILSNNWSDANSTLSLGSRVATQTEVAAALVTGIVPSNNGNNGTYSGGVENLPRFLENWSGIKFGYRGSMVVLYESTIATEPWGSSNVYNPPNRVWGFNQLFADGTFPPGRLISRSYRRLGYHSLNQAEFSGRLAALDLQ